MLFKPAADHAALGEPGDVRTPRPAGYMTSWSDSRDQAVAVTLSLARGAGSLPTSAAGLADRLLPLSPGGVCEARIDASEIVAPEESVRASRRYCARTEAACWQPYSALVLPAALRLSGHRWRVSSSQRGQ
jgi:hypothetical protein